MDPYQPPKPNVKRRTGRQSPIPGMNQGITLNIDAAKSRALQDQLGPGAVAVGGSDPLTGARFESSQGQAFEIEKAGKSKAVSDAVAAIGALKKILPVLNEFEMEFSRAFPNAEKQTGFPGKLASAKTVLKAKADVDPGLSAGIDQLMGKRSQITKGLGEVGNLAEQEQKIAMQNVPEMKFQGITDLILPEAPATGASKLKKFRDFINAQIQQNLDIINSGGDMSTVLQGSGSPVPGMPGNQSQNGSGIEQERQFALEAIEKGAPEDKVRDRFRAKTGQEL